MRSPLRIDVDDDEDAGDDGVMKGVEKGRGGGRRGREEKEGKEIKGNGTERSTYRWWWPCGQVVDVCGSSYRCPECVELLVALVLVLASAER